jgi:hypothetical protein
VLLLISGELPEQSLALEEIFKEGLTLVWELFVKGYGQPKPWPPAVMLNGGTS